MLNSISVDFNLISFIPFRISYNTLQLTSWLYSEQRPKTNRTRSAFESSVELAWKIVFVHFRTCWCLDIAYLSFYNKPIREPLARTEKVRFVSVSHSEFIFLTAFLYRSIFSYRNLLVIWIWWMVWLYNY